MQNTYYDITYLADMTTNNLCLTMKKTLGLLPFLFQAFEWNTIIIAFLIKVRLLRFWAILQYRH